MADVKQEVILGYGKFYIDEVEVALTRGGGQFVVEREFKVFEADGLRSAMVDGITLDKEQPKLTLNMLSIFQGADLTKLYPALQSKTVTTPAVSTEVTSAEDLAIAATDYHSVKWVGKTNKGKAITIEIEDAINLENIDWTLVDKDEVVQKLTYTGLAAAETKQCSWKVIFVD